MGRVARELDPSGGIYHVTCRGNNRAFVFADAADIKAFLDILLRYKRITPFRLLHYVVMGNHFHLTIEPSDEFTLSVIMQRVLLSFSHYYKKRHSFVGQLWQGRFHSKIISDDDYLVISGIYDELNPVRAHIVDVPENYPWSSYRFYAFGEANRLVDGNPLYETIGKNASERQIAYRSMVRMWQLMP